MLTIRIDQLLPGRQVFAINPELAGQHIAEREINPETTRLVSLQQTKPDGTDLDVDTLFDIKALAAHSVEIWSESKSRPDHYPFVGSAIDVVLKELLLGQTLELDLPEMGATCYAEIIRIDPCPPIEPTDEPERRFRKFNGALRQPYC